MKEEAHTLSTAYFRAVYTRTILLLHAACEKLTMCSLSDTLFALQVIGGYLSWRRAEGGGC